MTTPEGKIENYLVEQMRVSGGFVRKIKWIGRNGAPDRMVWWPSAPYKPAYIYFVELKRPGGKAEPQQLEEHKKLRESGITVFILDTIEKIDDFIKAHVVIKS